MAVISTRSARLAALQSGRATEGQRLLAAAERDRLAAADRDPRTGTEWAALIGCDPQGFDGLTRVAVAAEEVTSTDEQGRTYTFTAPERTATVTAVDTGRDVLVTARPRSERSARFLSERSAVPARLMAGAARCANVGPVNCATVTEHPSGRLAAILAAEWVRPVVAADLADHEPLLRALWHGPRPTTMAEARQRLAAATAAEVTDAATLAPYTVVGAVAGDAPARQGAGGTGGTIDRSAEYAARTAARQDAATARLVAELSSPGFTAPAPRRGRPAAWVALYRRLVLALGDDPAVLLAHLTGTLAD